jgi:hypothetical protein
MADQPKISRRSFFAGLGAVAAAGAATKLLPTSPAAAVIDSAISAPEPSGDSYRLTEHIKKYYRTTTI